MHRLFSVLCLWLLVLSGCASKHSPEKESLRYQQVQQSANMDFFGVELESAEDSVPEMSRSGVEMSRQRAGATSGNYSMGPNRSPKAKTGKTAQKAEVVQAQKQQPQSIHYNGYARLRVSRADDTADALSALALEVGGHVEALNPRRVSIRVPVESFREVFAKVLDMGDVLEKSISAVDISESLTSVKLRLNTSRATRDRLVVLLAKAEDENEKLELIRQIQRLTEEIDRLSGQSQTLHALAAFSRITVELVPRKALSQRSATVDIGELAWIRRLSPFRTSVGGGGDRLELETPDGFVELDPKGQFVVESADGSRLWTGRLENQPRGDTDFWLSAVKQRLADEFGSAEVIEKGSYKLLKLVDRAEDPYTYIIGVRADGKFLDLIEIYFPSATQEKRHSEAIDGVLAGGMS